MIDTNIYNTDNKPTAKEKSQIVNFLFTHLDQYGDKKEDIHKCLEYSMKKSKGGLIITSSIEGTIVAAAIINRTGMDGYIPENILVYIATHCDYRGRGIASALMNAIIENTDGNVALHVEHDNPAKSLYEKYGFTNKYLEMRLDKSLLKTNSMTTNSVTTNSMTTKEEVMNGTHNA